MAGKDNSGEYAPPHFSEMPEHWRCTVDVTPVGGDTVLLEVGMADGSVLRVPMDNEVARHLQKVLEGILGPNAPAEWPDSLH